MATNQAVLELEARELVQRIAPELRRLRPSGRGFALLLFDHESPGAAAYVSGSRRGDLVRVLGSLVLGLAAGGIRSAFDCGRPSA